MSFFGTFALTQKYENAILWLSYCLGATYFKRYWPYNGSFWRTTHLNPRKAEELESLIKDTEQLVNTHFQIWAQELITTVIAFSPKAKMLSSLARKASTFVILL